MARHSVQLTIPQPCTERWDAMTPAGNARHCSSCSSEVVDFTAMTDLELADYLQRFPGFGCGRFRADQLNRVIQPRELHIPRYAPLPARIAASAALLLGLAAPAAAQVHFGRRAQAVKAGKEAARKPPATTEPAQSCIRLRGTVCDAAGTAAPGATVELYWGTRLVARTHTNPSGQYELTTDLEIPRGTRLLKLVDSGTQAARLRYDVGAAIGEFAIRLEAKPAARFQLESSLISQPSIPDLHFMGFVVQHRELAPPPPRKPKFQLKL